MVEDFYKDPQWGLDEFEDYREFMFETYDIVIKNKAEFIADKYFSNSFKCERISELIEFFLLEEEFEKCSALRGIYNSLEILHFLKR